MTTHSTAIPNSTWVRIERAVVAATAEFDVQDRAKFTQSLISRLGTLPISVQQTAIPALADTDADDGWGPNISADEAVRLEQDNLALQVGQRRTELSASLSRVQAADVLGIAPQTVSEWAAQRRLVGLKDGREWRFPAWQFTPDDAEPVLHGVARLVDAFPGGTVSLSRWMGRPNDNFDGRTPAQEMIRDSERVFAVVDTLAAA